MVRAGYSGRGDEDVYFPQSGDSGLCSVLDGVRIRDPHEPIGGPGGGFTWVDVPEWSPDVEMVLRGLGCHEKVLEACRGRNHVPTVHAYVDHLFITTQSPLLGGAESRMRAGQPWHFGLHLVARPGDWKETYAHLARDLAGFRDLRDHSHDMVSHPERAATLAGRHVRGMAAQMLAAIGVETGAAAVAEHYGARDRGGVLDGWLVDTADAATLGRTHLNHNAISHPPGANQ